MEALQRVLSRLLAGVRSAPAGAVVAVLGVVGAVLVFVTEFSTIVSVDVLTAGTCEEIADPAARDACQTGGFEQHGGAFILIALVALLMIYGAVRGASRPAGAALVVLGAIVLAVFVLRDLPKADDTGLVGIEYEKAEAKPAAGFYFEVAGGLLLIGSGLVRVLWRGAPPGAPEERPRRARRTEAG